MVKLLTYNTLEAVGTPNVSAFSAPKCRQKRAPSLAPRWGMTGGIIHDMRPGTLPPPSGPTPVSDSNADAVRDLGFKFNQVQREDPASAVLVPQVDAAARRRRVVFVALALLAVALLALISRNRLGVETVGGTTRPGGTFRAPSDRSIE